MNRRNFLKGLVTAAAAPTVLNNITSATPSPTLGAMPKKVEGTAVPYDRNRKCGMVRGDFAALLYPGLYAAWLEHLKEERLDEYELAFSTRR